MNTWLRDHLIRTGAMTEHGVTRGARARTCRKCGASTVAGLTDHAICAIEAEVDPQPLNAFGELLALLGGRYTVAAHAEAGKFVLDVRGAWAIEGRPAATTPRVDVLAEHRCGQPLPPAGLGASALAAGYGTHLPAGSPAPF